MFGANECHAHLVRCIALASSCARASELQDFVPSFCEVNLRSDAPERVPWLMTDIETETEME